MLWIGIDTHLRMHEVEIQNENGKKMWHGRVENSREGFSELHEKIRTIEESNSDRIWGVFMNPTGNYHMPVKYFLESNGYDVYAVDARKTEHLRMIQNLGKEKSDQEDASILASTARLDAHAISKGHERLPESGLTRLLEQLKRNATMIANVIASDLAAVFPEYNHTFEIDSKVSLRILETYSIPEEIIKADTEDLFALMDTGKCHCHIGDAVKFKIVAENSIGIPDPEKVYAYRIKMNASILKEEIDRIKDVEREIREKMSENADVKNISDIHGIAMTSAAVMVAEIGSIGQFSSAVKLQSYGGKSPNITGSGGKLHRSGLS